MNTKTIVILTGFEERHKFFYNYLLNNQFENYKILKIFCEDDSKSLINLYKENTDLLNLYQHVYDRNLVENDFFGLYNHSITDLGYQNITKIIKKGTINHDVNTDEILNLNPDIIISYGCSIIEEKLINHFQNRFINIHLGLSPYYRGSGTNFWPLVNNEPFHIGVTYMYIDNGIDTGKILHQIRPDLIKSDNVHSIGNRLIIKMTKEVVKIISNFYILEKGIPNIEYSNLKCKYYKKKDFNEIALEKMYDNFSKKMLEDYLKNKVEIDQKFPIIKNSYII